jgi:CheY-like chemotaxis protein
MGLSPDRQNSSLAEISRASERAAGLTRQLLAFSRRQVMQATALDLNDVISGMVKMLHRIIGEDIDLQTRLLSRGAPIYGDPGMIEQVLLNLAVNARDAMPAGGEIAIEVARITLDEAASALRPQSRPGDFIRLIFRDTGSGIAPEHLPRIFEPFFTTKDVGKGTGLGLATVHGIVAQHQGWIDVESTLGKGTKFHIYLPRLASAQPAEAAGPPAARVRGGNETILLVEDEVSVRTLAVIVLERHGYRVIEARNGVAALKLWSQHRAAVDLLLTDLIMPEGLSGRELAEQLRADKPELRVIYMSGYPGETAGRGLDLREGVNFLAKPFGTAKLAQAVRDCLDGATGIKP